MQTTTKQFKGKSRILILAVFGALVVANVQSAFAQKSYQISTLAETFGDSVVGLGAIADNGTFLGYAQGGAALITRNSIQPIADPPGLPGAGYSGINSS